MPRKLKPIHPGEILQADFLDDLGVTKYRLAKDAAMPADRIGKIVAGQRSITADTALRLSRYFGTTAQFWMNLQARYDLDVARDQYGPSIDSEVRTLAG